MAIQDHFTDEERARQEGLTRSWEANRHVMADPEHRARIEAAIARIDSGPRPKPMTGEEFIEWAASLSAERRAG